MQGTTFTTGFHVDVGHEGRHKARPVGDKADMRLVSQNATWYQSLLPFLVVCWEKKADAKNFFIQKNMYIFTISSN